MTVYAGNGIEVITGGRRRKPVNGGFVTLSARSGRVSASEFKLSFLVPRQRKCGRLKTIQGVAQFALVCVARTLELSGMGVFVAIETKLVRDFVAGLFALRDVALFARYRRMFAG
jgi:hypothetical protein